MNLTSFVSNLEDHLRSQGQRYKFSSLIFTCILGHCCGYSGCREIARFARANKKIYSTKPSYVTFHSFLNDLDHEKLSSAFHA